MGTILLIIFICIVVFVLLGIFGWGVQILGHIGSFLFDGITGCIGCFGHFIWIIIVGIVLLALIL